MTTYIIGGSFGVFALFLFGWSEFEKVNTTLISASPIFSKVTPKELTDRSFSGGRMLYILVLILAYVLACAIGAGIWKAFDIKPVPENVVPFIIALAFFGLVPHLPFLSQIEKSWRSFVHALIAVPNAAMEIAVELRGRSFGLTHIPHEAFDRDRVASTFLKADNLNRLQKKWIRITALIKQVEFIQAKGGARGRLGISFAARHQSVFRDINHDFRALWAEIFSDTKDEHILSEDIDPYEDRIKLLEHRIIDFIACMIVTRPSKINREDSVEYFGFSKSEKPNIDEILSNETDTFIYAWAFSIAVAFAIFVFVPILVWSTGISSAYTLHMTNINIIKSSAQNLGFGSDLLNAFLSIIIRFSIVLFFAHFLRHAFIVLQKWYKRSQIDERSIVEVRARNYLITFLASYIVAFATLVIERLYLTVIVSLEDKDALNKSFWEIFPSSIKLYNIFALTFTSKWAFYPVFLATIATILIWRFDYIYRNKSRYSIGYQNYFPIAVLILLAIISNSLAYNECVEMRCETVINIMNIIKDLAVFIVMFVMISAGTDRRAPIAVRNSNRSSLAHK